MKHNREKQTEALNKAQAKRKEIKREQVLKAIEVVIQQGAKLTFKNIADVAGCSVSYLYKWDDIKAYIHEVQKRQNTTLNELKEKEEKSGVYSLKTLHEVAKDRIRQLEAKIEELERQNKLLRGHIAEIHELRLEKVGGQAKLAQLLNRTVSAVNIDRHAALVLDKYQRRQIVHAGHEIVDLGYDTANELETVIDLVEDKVHGLTTDSNSKFPTLPVNERLADIFNQLEQGALPNYPTGLADLDSMIGGLTKKDLVIVAARPSMGKSWFACYLANYIASNEKKPVVFFSAEMDGNQLTKRFLAMHTGIDSLLLMNNDIKRSEMETLVKGLGTLAELPIEINDTPAEQLTPAKMRSLVEENSV